MTNGSDFFFGIHERLSCVKTTLPNKVIRIKVVLCLNFVPNQN